MTPHDEPLGRSLADVRAGRPAAPGHRWRRRARGGSALRLLCHPLELTFRRWAGAASDGDGANLLDSVHVEDVRRACADPSVVVAGRHVVAAVQLVPD